MKNVNYKLLALMPMFVLTGCGEKIAHRNIITDKVEKGNEKAFVIKDAKTNVERVYEIGPGLNAKDNFDCFQIGDTISIYTGGVYRSEDYYQNNTILHSGEFGMSYNTDVIKLRAENKRRATLNQQTTKQR